LGLFKSGLLLPVAALARQLTVAQAVLALVLGWQAEVAAQATALRHLSAVLVALVAQV